MSQSHEPSYYEIALTNRQVLVVFVVLLVCVVAAFFSGVWIGRQGDGPPAAQIAEVDSNDAVAAGENGEVEELKFFTDESTEGTPSLSEVAEDPKAETTLAEDVGVAEASGDEGVEPRLTVEEEPSPSAQNATIESAEPGEAGATESDSTPPARASEVQMAEGDHVIQVFSSADESQAKKLISQLSGGGFPAFLSPVEVGGQTMYRVRIGPYTELSEAETVAAQVRRSFKLDTWVTR